MPRLLAQQQMSFNGIIGIARYLYGSWASCFLSIRSYIMCNIKFYLKSVYLNLSNTCMYVVVQYVVAVVRRRIDL